MTRVEMYNLGDFGVVSDVPSHLLEPEAWSDGGNVRFDERGVRRTAGHTAALGTPSIAPHFLMNAPGLGASYWIYASLAKAYVYEGGVHTNITRQGMSGDDDYTVDAGYKWNGTILGGVPVLNNGMDVPQYWTLDIGDELANLTNWDTNTRAKVLRAFGQYLIALNVTESGVQFNQSIMWSSKADPGTLPASWDYNDPTVEAGRIQLTDAHGGDILDGILLGDLLIIYQQYSTHALRFVGGNDIFAPQLLLSTAGLMAPRCACAFKRGTGHVALTVDDVIAHKGQRDADSIIDKRNRRRLFNEIDGTNFNQCFVFENVLTSEVWIAYPESGQAVVTKAAIWNYKDNTWTFRDFTGNTADFGSVTDASPDAWDDDAQIWDADDETWSTESRSQLLVGDAAATEIDKLDSGFLFGSSSPLAFVERTGIAIDGKSRDGKPRASISSRKLLKRVWPKVNGVPINVWVGSQEDVGRPVDWLPAQSFDPTTQEYIDCTVNGRLLALRFEMPEAAGCQLEGYDIDVEKISEF